MLEAFGQAIVNLGEWHVLLFLSLGVIVGLVLGIIPGLSALVGVALVLPFIFKMDPMVGLPFAVAIDSVAFTGGALTAILLNIPGTGPNAPTMIDGFPLAQKGQAGRAIGAAIGSSTFGGILSVPLAFIMIPLVVPLVMQFRAPEMFFTIVLGLSFLAILAKGSMIKGLISGGLGIVISFIGYNIITGVPRFTFGMIYLYDGIDIVPLALGLFALPELIDISVKGTSIAKVNITQGSQFRQVWEGVKDVIRHKWLWLRSSLIGYIIGVIPGIGAEAAVFVAYAQAKQISKYPEKFGTGIIEGVIAPESANNAKEGGALLTTMAFGIPGSAVMAILIGAFLMVGITPGPTMLLEHTDLAFTMLLGIVLANLLAGVICFFGAPYLIKITAIQPQYLIGMVLPIVYVGAYIKDEMMLNIIVALVFTIVGIFMKKFGYSRPALLLGFVLGGLFEYYFLHSVELFGNLFFVTPISLALIAIIAIILSSNIIRPLFNRWFKRREGESP